MKNLIAALAAGLMLFLGACTTESPAPLFTNSDPAYEDSNVIPFDIQVMAMEKQWGSSSASEQALMCLGWSEDPDAMIDSLNEGFNGAAAESGLEGLVLSDAVSRRFYNQKCSSLST